MWGYHGKNVALNKGEIFHTVEHMAWLHAGNTSFFSREHSSNAKSYDDFEGFSLSDLSALGGLVI